MGNGTTHHTDTVKAWTRLRRRLRHGHDMDMATSYDAFGIIGSVQLGETRCVHWSHQIHPNQERDEP